MARAFFFEADQLATLADKYGDEYRWSAPFSHVVIDDFLPPEVLDGVLTEFPEPRAVDWQMLSHAREEKLALADDTQMGPITRHLLAQFNSSTFIAFLESLTGIDGLIPDPHFVGGGLHQIERGGFLKVHADFNIHKRLRLDRRLNALVYLNRDWQEDFGGHLQLWSRDMSHCERKVLPVFGRCVIFSTTDWSYHGHPDPLNCPPGWSRKSLALYYYSNGRPAEEMAPSHSTLFRERPNEQGALRLGTKAVVRQLVPPILVDAGRSVRRRVKSGRSGTSSFSERSDAAT